jgi:hypothetical protein
VNQNQERLLAHDVVGKLEDAELVRRALKREGGAFRTIMQKYNQRLRPPLRHRCEERLFTLYLPDAQDGASYLPDAQDGASICQIT